MKYPAVLLRSATSHWLGIRWSIGCIGILTLLSAAIIEIRVRCPGPSENR